MGKRAYRVVGEYERGWVVGGCSVGIRVVSGCWGDQWIRGWSVGKEVVCGYGSSQWVDGRRGVGGYEGAW